MDVAGDLQPDDALPKRILTRLQRSKLEALQAFNNCSFDDLNAKKVWFQDKLKKGANEENTSTKQKVHLTQLQKANIEAVLAFRNVPLEELVPKKSTKRTGSEASDKSENNSQQKRQRREPSRKTNTKMVSNATRKCKENRSQYLASLKSSAEAKSDSVNTGVKERFANSMKNVEKKNFVFGTTKGASEVNLSEQLDREKEIGLVIECVHEDEAMEDVGFVDDVVTDGSEKTREEIQPVMKLSRLEAAKLEALKSFGGKGLDDIVKSSTKVVARCFESNNIKKQEDVNLPCGDEIPESPIPGVRKGTLLSNGSDSGISEDGDSVESILEKSRQLVEEAKSLETP